MDILKTAVNWAKAEVISAQIFILFGILFLLGSGAAWQWGKLELSRAFVAPMLVAGGIFLAAGLGFYFNNKTRLSNFESDYQASPTTFVQSELARTEKTMSEYQNIAFKAFPAIIALAILLALLVNHALWRASSITTIVFFILFLLLDYNANNRIKAYHQQLKIVANSFNK